MKRIIAGGFLVTSIAIAVIWYLGLVNDNLLTIAIAALGLASIFIIDFPALLRDKNRRGK